MNSKYVFSVFHPEYLVDLLRAGGRFPVRQSFSLPVSSSTKNEIRDFIDKRFPPLSEERHEIWLKFCLPRDKSTTWFSLEDIESAHFYSNHRQEAVERGVLHTLNVYGIPVGEPLDTFTESLIEVYSEIVRGHTAATIVKAWFPEITISNEFIDQVKIGYVHQQSPTPEKLQPIPSKFIWAHMVAYNAGLRKFDERPDVLWLQDIQEVIRRTDAEFKQELKSIGDKYSSKFSDLIDGAESSKKSGIELSKWLLLNKTKEKTYLFELDQFLSGLGKQQSFFYSALLYLYWREKILNADFTGRLDDNKVIGYFLKNTTDNSLRQSVAEALFTIVYAGGPRVFQKALIEARMRILGLAETDSRLIEKGTPVSNVSHLTSKSLITRIFANIKKELGKIFVKKYDMYSEEKKKEILKKVKAISLAKTKISKGEFNYDQYLKLCSLFEVPEEQFDDQPSGARLIQNDADGENNENSNFSILSQQNDELQVSEIPKDNQFNLKTEQDKNLAQHAIPLGMKNKKPKAIKLSNTKEAKKDEITVGTVELKIDFPAEGIKENQVNKDFDE